MKESVKIKAVIGEVKDLILREANASDIQYFDFHEKRFERMANAVCALIKPGGVILEISSHYLHSSLILTKLGFQVSAMDVSVFWEVPFVKKRGEDYGINKIIENDLEWFDSHRNVSEKYDLVLFTEILEHITFNPINFWKVLHSSVKDGGNIYISTPNSFALPGLLRAIKNVVIFKGIGLSVDQIFSNVTYGHHWKEYSSREIRQYFRKLSDDFTVTTKRYDYKKFDGKSMINFTWSVLSVLGRVSYYFSSDIEAVVTVKKNHNKWKLEAPEY